MVPPPPPSLFHGCPPPPPPSQSRVTSVTTYHPYNLVQHIGNLLNDSSCSDFTLTIRTETTDERVDLYAHRLILMQSNYFKQIVMNPKLGTELLIEWKYGEVENATRALQLVYGQNPNFLLNLPCDSACHVLKFLLHYQFTGCVEQVMKYFNSSGITVDFDQEKRVKVWRIFNKIKDESSANTQDLLLSLIREIYGKAYELQNYPGRNAYFPTLNFLSEMDEEEFFSFFDTMAQCYALRIEGFAKLLIHWIKKDPEQRKTQAGRIMCHISRRVKAFHAVPPPPLGYVPKPPPSHSSFPPPPPPSGGFVPPPPPPGGIHTFPPPPSTRLPIFQGSDNESEASDDDWD